MCTEKYIQYFRLSGISSEVHPALQKLESELRAYNNCELAIPYTPHAFTRTAEDGSLVTTQDSRLVIAATCRKALG